MEPKQSARRTAQKTNMPNSLSKRLSNALVFSGCFAAVFPALWPRINQYLSRLFSGYFQGWAFGASMDGQRDRTIGIVVWYQDAPCRQHVQNLRKRICTILQHDFINTIRVSAGLGTTVPSCAYPFARYENVLAHWPEILRHLIRNTWPLKGRSTQGCMDRWMDTRGLN